MTTKSTMRTNTFVAASVAPEDLRCGDFVAVLSELVEYAPQFWCDETTTDLSEPVRIRFMDLERRGALKVKAICLPFVFVKLAVGDHETLDVRRQEIVRLERSYGNTVWKQLKRHIRRQRKRD